MNDIGGIDPVSKIDATVRKETIYVAVWEAILTAIMLAVFLIVRAFDVSVLVSALLGTATAVLNFLLMGLTIQGALGLEEKDARTRLRGSQNLRLLMQTVVAVLGAAIPWLNLWAVLIPLFFPRIAIMLRPLFIKN